MRDGSMRNGCKSCIASSAKSAQTIHKPIGRSSPLEGQTLEFPQRQAAAGQSRKVAQPVLLDGARGTARWGSRACHAVSQVRVAGTVAMFVSKQVIEKLEGEQTRLRRDVKYLRHAAERGDNLAVRVHAEDLASRLENHASLVDAVIEAVSEDSVSDLP